MIKITDLIKNYIVIGGNTSGLAAANQIRRLHPDVNITVLESGRYISYGSCGLPYFISGEVERIENLLVYSKEYFEQKKKIKIFPEHTVTGVDTLKKEITAKAGNFSECDKLNVTFPYDRLVICSGASPLKFSSIEGINSNNVFYFKNVEDAIRLKDYIKTNNPKNAVIVGGGYIGLLLADSLSRSGLKVSIIEAKQKIYSDYEDEITDELAKAILNSNIRIYFNSKLTKINYNRETNTAFLAVTERTGNTPLTDEIEGDIFIISAGIKANTGFLAGSPINLGQYGAIKTSSTLQTSLPSVFAAGDCCLIKNIITKSYEYIPSAGNALKTGRIAGANAAGENEIFPGSLNTKIDKIFDMETARTGIGFRTAIDYKFDPIKISDRYPSHAASVPGSQMVDTCIIVDKKTRKILGAQMIGKEGVGKRIDIFAVAITADLKVDDLYMMDTSYSPYISTLPDMINKICGKAVLALNRAGR